MINPTKVYTVEEYIEILRRRIWYIIVPFVVILAGAAVYALVAPRQYKASALILVSPQKIPEAFVQPTVTSNVNERLQSIAQEVLSQTRLEAILKELNLYEKERQELSTEEVIALMRKDIDIELPSRQLQGSFRVSYTGLDPDIVAMVTNRLTSQFIEENLKIRERQAVGTTEFLSSELTTAKEKLDKMETAMTQYKKTYMGQLPEQLDTNLKILDQLQNQYQRIGDALRSAQDRKLVIQKQLSDLQLAMKTQATDSNGELSSSMTTMKDGKDEATASPTATDTEEYYESRKEALARTLDELRMKYTHNHPDVIIAEKKLAEFESKKLPRKRVEAIAYKKAAFDINKDPRYKELTNQLTVTNLEIKRLLEEEPKVTQQITAYRARIEQIPSREQEMSSLLREYQSTKEAYGSLLKKSQEAQQAENLEKKQKGEQFRIIDPARVPEKPFSPNVPKIILLALIAAMGVGFGSAFLREQIDRSFHDPADVENTLGLKVLATIPRIERKEA